MSTYSKKNKNKQKKQTKKIESLKKTLVSYYAKNYKKTKLIPTTNIINYMKKNFNEYNKLKDELEKQGKYVIYLDDCFDFGDKLKSGERVYSFESQINGNPNISLDKLIAYSFYIKTKYAFINETDGSPSSNSRYLETLKYQMGKDIRRDDRTINGKEYSSELYYDTSKNNYEIADMFYQTIIDYFYRINKVIDYDVINKICLLSCQNMFNLITDMVTIKLQDMLSPELNSVFRPVKSANIIIEIDKKTMEFHFDSQLIISRDGEPIDPEYPCGNLIFKLLFDFNTSTFKFTQFKISYNIDNCGPPKNNIKKKDATTLNDSTNSSSIKLQYAIPVALGIGGIVSTPFILGAIGGLKNQKTPKNKKNLKKPRTFKIKRKNKYLLYNG
jgi:hypothetical protein